MFGMLFCINSYRGPILTAWESNNLEEIKALRYKGTDLSENVARILFSEVKITEDSKKRFKALFPEGMVIPESEKPYIQELVKILAGRHEILLDLYKLKPEWIEDVLPLYPHLVLKTTENKKQVDSKAARVTKEMMPKAVTLFFEKENKKLKQTNATFLQEKAYLPKGRNAKEKGLYKGR